MLLSLLLFADVRLVVNGPDIHAAVASLAAATRQAVVAPVVPGEHRAFTVSAPDLPGALVRAATRLGLAHLDPEKGVLGFRAWPRGLVAPIFAPAYHAVAKAAWGQAVRAEGQGLTIATRSTSSIRLRDPQHLEGLESLQVHWVFDDILVAARGRDLASRELALRAAKACGASFREENDRLKITFDAKKYRDLLAAELRGRAAGESDPFFRAKWLAQAEVAAELDLKVIEDVMKERGSVRERFFLLPKENKANSAINRVIVEMERIASPFAPEGSIAATYAARLTRMDTRGPRRIMFVEPGLIIIMIPGHEQGRWIGL